MTVFRFKPYTERPDVELDRRYLDPCYRWPDGSWAGYAGPTNPPRQRAELARRLRTDGYRLRETLDDGTQVYEQVAMPKPKLEAKPVRLSASFAAFCRPVLVRPRKADPTFTDMLSIAGITLHGAGCWCPAHNRARKAKLAA